LRRRKALLECGLPAVAEHDVLGAPGVLVGEEEGLAEELAQAARLGGLVHGERQGQAPGGPAQPVAEQLPQVAGLEARLDLATHRRLGGRLALRLAGLAPAAQPAGQRREAPLPLVERGQPAPDLRLIQGGGPGHLHRPVRPVEHAGGAVGPHPAQALAGQRLEPAAGDRPEVGMLGGDQRPDEVGGALLEEGEALGAVVALVADPGGVEGWGEDRLVPPGQGLEDGAKRGRVRPVAGRGVVEGGGGCAPG